jgi:4,5-DOPA dioxygenase extradiol
MYPVIFIGHGSPMNAIDQNEFTENWRKIALSIPKPKIILSISAHWVTRGTQITGNEDPKTIYDFYGFPQELYQVQYPAKGDVDFANRVNELLGDAIISTSWGLDHGTWSVLSVMYPDADVKVLQISLDHFKTPAEHYEIGRKLHSLRDNVLIMGTGNVVHNLRLASFNAKGGFEWAEPFDNYIRENIINRNHDNIINYQNIPNYQLAIPTTEHFDPLLYIIGAATEDDKIEVYNEKYIYGSLSMTSYVFKNE